ncbi:hypothetical protein AVEN_152010-1 [Araneus ventricosus]|uniref:Uncharacterized protein n=1 Tax=Araneus ventricosus TaxID=182803 RepID=A0A4Y2LZQ7_ARAVE|nr:hypothetical protein AVEN_152010-1 [Araneus ventricosus]
MDPFGNDEVFIKELRNLFGNLWDISELMGISLREEGNKNISNLSKKLIFPLVLHCNLIYLWYSTIRRGLLDYSTILDMIIPSLTCVLWWTMYINRKSPRKLLSQLTNTTLIFSLAANRYLQYVTNAVLCFTFIFPLLLSTVKAFIFPTGGFSGEYKNAMVFLWAIQGIIFPSAVTLMYITICILLLQNTRHSKNLFDTNLDLSLLLTSRRKLCQRYLEVLREVEHFEELFSNPVLIVVLQYFCTVSIIVMDMMNIENWLPKLMIEASFYLPFIFIFLGVLSIYAANIPLEMQRIKVVLLDKAFEETHGVIMLEHGKQVDSLLKRKICVLTAGNVFTFDRGFLFKVPA